MARNGEAHDAFYGARNHAPPEGSHPLMSGLKLTQMEKVISSTSDRQRHGLQRAMGDTDTKAGGWDGRQRGLDPQTHLGGDIDKRRREAPGEVIKLGQAPPKRFKPKGR